MIAIDGENHTITVKGSGIGIRAEFTALIREMLKRNILDEDDVDFAVRLAKMSPEELHEERDRKWEELRQTLDESGTGEERAMFALASMIIGGNADA